MVKSELKKRNWSFILYNDSCSPDWEEFLISTGIPFAYAYHDKDTNPTGEPKVPHYHVMICSDGPITYQNAKTYADRVGAKNGIIQPVGSVRGMVRYFCHLDNPEKYQYPDTIIQCRNGFDPKDYFSLTVSQQKAFKRKVTQLISDNGIEEYAELVDYLLYLDEMDMYDVATQNVFYFTSYIRSKRNIHLKKEVEKSKHRKDML